MSCEHPRNDFERSLCSALAQFKAISRPERHVLSVEKKDRVNFLIRQIEALQRADIERPDIKNKINEMIDDILALQPASGNKTGLHGEMTAMPNLSDIRRRSVPFELLCSQNVYHVRNMDNNTQAIAHDPFVFVITVATPWRVVLGARIDGGHTAVSRGSDVFYAGEIEFDNGTLISWCNESGHYQPVAALHPQVEAQLPPDKFKVKH